MKPLALVIENDAGTRKLLDVLLARFGFEVDLVATGSDALILLDHVRYDAIFIDLLIPGLSGTEVLAWIARERPDLLSRAIVLSSSAPARLEALREQYPPLRTIRKPFELGEVLEAAQLASGGRTTRASNLAESFCRHSVRGGAKAGVIVARRGHMVEPVLGFGYGRDVVESFFPMSIDGDYPICKAIRSQEPQWIASIPRAMQDFPQLATIWQRNETRAVAAVPLFEHGQIIGAAGWSFREPRLFSEAEQSHFLAIADRLMEPLAVPPVVA